MVVLTAANTPSTKVCPECSGTVRIRMKLIKSKLKIQKRFLVMGLIEIPGTIMRIWSCDNCGLYEDAGTKWVGAPAPDPVRPEIVNAIRRLRNAGHKFFDWETRR